MPVWWCSLLYQLKNVSQWAMAWSRVSNRVGQSGRYFNVLKPASAWGFVMWEYGCCRFRDF